MKLALAESVKERRQKVNLIQQELAKRIGSSQSRVAKMEAADSSVSMDLLVRSLAAMGETALRDAIAGIQRQGVRVGLYIEGYLLDVDGMVYEDAWNGRPATVTRQGDQAVVNLELGLQQVGCLVVRRL